GEQEPATPEAFPIAVAVAGVPGWESDVLVVSSPTLDRDGAARRRLYPDGWVEINRHDAGAVGIRAGWPVRLVSDRANVTLPAVVRDDLDAGVVQLSWSAREALGDPAKWPRPPAVRLVRT
ncbi:MAG: molybdopterin dinucleotide binding domain-containing protein, partial [Acidobacteriota bacterium]